MATRRRGGRRRFQDFLTRYRTSRTVIIVASRADFYADEALRHFIAYGRMGTRLVLAEGTSAARVKILLPERDDAGRYHEREAWVDANAVVEAPLRDFDATDTDEEKERILTETGIGGATLLRFPGHIMLYMGEDGGKPYTIHSTWSYREKRGFREITRLVNRVAVSDLELGRGGKKGSHLHRLTNATVVTLP